MEPRVSFVTLGVADLERAARFYEQGLGKIWLSLWSLAHVAKFGGKVTKPGHRTDCGGYAGYFADPDFPHV